MSNFEEWWQNFIHLRSPEGSTKTYKELLTMESEKITKELAQAAWDAGVYAATTIVKDSIVQTLNEFVKENKQ